MKMIKGIYFDEENWDGSDIFMFSDNLVTMALEPVKQALRKIRGLSYSKAIDEEYDYLKRSDLEDLPLTIRKDFEHGLIFID
jgi:hypothetical protein